MKRTLALLLACVLGLSALSGCAPASAAKELTASKLSANPSNSETVNQALAAFGLEAVEIDGHDFDQIEAAMEKAKATKDVPTAIVMKTTKGKGVSFMENQAGWHGKAPNDEQAEAALGELGAVLAGLEAV